METERKKNSLTDLIKFFGTSDRPVSPAEFREFWNSLSDTDEGKLSGKSYYLYAAI